MMNKDIFRNFTLHTLLSIGLSAALLLSPLCAATLIPPIHAKAADTEEVDTEETDAEETGTEETGDPLWSEDYYRASDSSGELSDAERNELDSICIEFMKKYHADLSLLSISQERLGDMALREAAEQYYEESGFGYGDGRDGFQMILNLDTNEVAIVPIGAAVEMIPEEYLRRFETSAAGFREQYGVFGPFYATTRHLNNYMEQHASQATEKSDAAVQNSDAAAESSTQADVLPITDITARVGEGSDKPAWFPVNPDSFPEYHDETAPRIVDTADLFTEEEEMQMEARLAEIRSELNKDIVVATDVSSYGLDQSIYAADFYDFNGYGIGDQFEGVVLFICMDPNDRGWFVTCTGPETRALYTEQIANQMDDMLYEYMSAGRYSEGVSDWIENFRRLYKTGSPYLPDWAALDINTFERFHDETAARVIDEAGLLTEQEIADLEAHAREISEKYGQDVVIHTAVSSGSMSRQDYSDLFYYFNGYGSGDDYEGILLSVFKQPRYKASVSISAFGKCADKLTDVNRGRLEDRCTDALEIRRYYDALNNWLSQTDHMLRTGRVPHSDWHWIVSVFLSLAGGLIFGGVSLARAYARMETPKIAEDANTYYVKNSSRIRRISDTFLRRSFSQTYSPEETRSSDSGSSSSGGGSTYKSSYSGSSGRTHSGSGRKF